MGEGRGMTEGGVWEKEGYEGRRVYEGRKDMR